MPYLPAAIFYRPNDWFSDLAQFARCSALGEMRDQRLLGSPPVDAIGQPKREHVEVSLVVVRRRCSHASKLRVSLLTCI